MGAFNIAQAQVQAQQQVALLPDLVVTKATNFRVYPQQHLIYFDMEFKNIGTARAALPVVFIRAELSIDSSIGQDVGIGTKEIYLGDTYGLAPGATRSLLSVPFNYGAKNLSNYPYIVVRANGGVALQESNLTNNKTIFIFQH